MLTTKDYPDHHDAELVLKLYELRREPAMRDSRNAIAAWTPKTYDDIKGVVSNRAHPLNAAWRQTTTYWEMVYGMAKHGIIHADFLAESTGEGMLLFAKVQPFLEEIRRDTSPRSFMNAEWMHAHSDMAKAIFESHRQRLAKAAKEGK